MRSSSCSRTLCSPIKKKKKKKNADFLRTSASVLVLSSLQPPSAAIRGPPPAAPVHDCEGLFHEETEPKELVEVNTDEEENDQLILDLESGTSLATLTEYVGSLPRWDLRGTPVHIAKVFTEASTFTVFADALQAAALLFDTSECRSNAMRHAQTCPGFDQAQIKRDSCAFAMDPIAAVKALGDEFAHSRVSVERLSSLNLDAFPERDTVMNIAGGMDPILPSGFVPILTAAAVRPSNKEIQPVIDALVALCRLKGEVLVIDRATFIEAVTRLGVPASLAEIGHTYKPDDLLGRLLYDYKHLRGAIAPNSRSVIPQLQEVYGPLVLPTVPDLYHLFYRLKALFPGIQLHVGKTDVHRAFQRIRWTPLGSVLLGILVSEELVAIPIGCGFGHCNTPYIYGPFSRLFQFLHDAVVRLGLIYIDDKMMFAPPDLLKSELTVSCNTIKHVFGPSGVKESKTVASQCEVLLGIASDLSREIAYPCFRSYLKLVHIFFRLIPIDISHNTKLPLCLVQATANLTYRHAVHIPLLRGSAFQYFALTKGIPTARQHRRFPVQLSQQVVDDTLLWRTVLVAAFTDFRILQSSLKSVIYNDRKYLHEAQDAADLLVYSDASPNCMGVFIPNLGYLQFNWPESEKSHDIAVFELMAAVIAFQFATYISPHSRHIHLFIDNQNAIAWSTGRNRSTSHLSRRLVSLNCYLQALNPAVLQTRSYIKSSWNVSADAISRNNLNHPSLRGLPRYRLTPKFQAFLISLSKCSPKTAFPNLVTKHTVLASTSFSRI